MVRLAAVTVSLLPFLLNTAAACGAVPEFDCCPDRATHASHEPAPAAPDRTAAQKHAGTELLPSAVEVSQTDSDNCDVCDCEYCKGFFLAHLNTLPAAFTVSGFPTRSVVHSDPRQLAIKFIDPPPTPPPQTYRV